MKASSSVKGVVVHVGTITTVCTSSLPAVLPKYEQESVVVEEFGLRGDYHRDPRMGHHVCIVAHEALELMNAKLGLVEKPLRAGSLGENITTRGLGDLSDLSFGSGSYPKFIRIQGALVFEVVGRNEPFSSLMQYHVRLMSMHGKLGLLCRVLPEAIDTVIRPNNGIEIIY